jgi:hypothetical protein
VRNTPLSNSGSDCALQHENASHAAPQSSLATRFIFNQHPQVISYFAFSFIQVTRNKKMENKY